MKIEVPEVTEIELAFGTTKYLPKYEDVPEEFKHSDNIWVNLFNRLFYTGCDFGVINCKNEYDSEKVMRLLRAHMISYAPKHEHKVAGVAYMMSQYLINWL